MTDGKVDFFCVPADTIDALTTGTVPLPSIFARKQL
jgi:hypothetical protein